MDIFFQILVMLLLALVFFQDLKLRAIHMLLPLFILILGIILYLRGGHSLLGLLYSATFLMLTFIGLYVYLSIKNKALTNPFKKTMGLGDVLFFISVLPFFSTYNYILFFITGMVFSIIGFLVIKLFSKTSLVPLAGLLALYLIVLQVGSYFTNVDFFFHTIM